jgi:hypothetical protein
VSVFRAEFILKVSSPNTLTTSTISEWVTCLQHKLLDDSVEDNIVVITIVDVGDEVLDCLGCRIWE